MVRGRPRGVLPALLLLWALASAAGALDASGDDVPGKLHLASGAPAPAEREALRAAAQAGDAAARNNLGVALIEARGDARDLEGGVALLGAAAGAGLAQAQTNLAYLLLDPTLGAVDPAAAARWLEVAANQGFAPAQSMLGRLYQDGRGVPGDSARALSLFHRAAVQGHVRAERYLGRTYHRGIGTAVDLVEAVRWYLAGDAKGDDPSSRGLEEICSAQLIPGCPGEVVVLLREDDGRIGKVLVEAGDGSQVLLEDDFSTSRVGASGEAKAVAAGSDHVSAIFADVLAEMPPEPARYEVLFAAGSATVAPGSETVLAAAIRRVRAELRRRDTVEVIVIGHTDRAGESGDNDRLSRARAEQVRERLLATGIDPARVQAQGRGERAPKVKTPDGTGERRNRRVEILVR